MKVVAHISDPHFGAQDKHIARALLDELGELEPACIVVSGDLTQRGRRAQYKRARAWLAELPAPSVVVPGNHDIPLFDVFSRFLRPRQRYARYITHDLTPWFVDDTLAICGVDTTKSLTTKHGEITREQITHALSEIGPFEDRWKLLVAHHPFIVPRDSHEPRVEGAQEVLPLLEQAGIDLILTGHLHLADSAGRNEGHTIIHVQAGTCISTRTRGEPNGYNQLRFEGDEVTIVHREWDGRHFYDREAKSYVRGHGADRLVKVAEVLPAPLQHAH